MIFAIVFLPLFSFIAVGLFSRFIGRNGSAVITSGSVILSFFLSAYLFYCYTLQHKVIFFHLFSWIKIGVLNAHWGFLVDPVTSTMLIVITSISSLVHLYSIEYMAHDPHLPRFMSYLSLFTFCMLMLVTANNFLQMFFGWEGVGLSSYLLINFWHTRIQANKSAMKAIIVNRIGDFGLIIAMIAIFDLFKSFDFAIVFALSSAVANQNFVFLNTEINCITFISFFLFVGAVGKSAQLGLHTWLPDAMEGPTPVSALIHAATMVTAGVFLLIRCSPLIEHSETALSLITVFGGLTAFFAATVALVQNDLKRVIAYSTCSQLGYMVFCCGLSSYNVAMFHLMNHAFFKALLFLSAGSVIHGISDEQDMRKMGGLVNLLPFTYSAMLIGSLSLMGFPFLTGFYSKDLILEIARNSYSFEGRMVYWLGTLSAFFTAFYSIRLLYLTFITKTNAYKSYIKRIHEPSSFMLIPLVILVFCSIFVGYLFRDMFVGLGSDFWNNSIYVKPIHLYSDIESEFLPAYIKMLPVGLSLFSATLAFYLYTYQIVFLSKLKTYSSRLMGVYKYLNKRWFFDVIYNNYITNKALELGYKITFKVVDRGFIEWLGPTGIVNSIQHTVQKTSKIQSGFLYHYMLLILAGLLVFLVFFVSTGFSYTLTDLVKLTVIFGFIFLFLKK